MITSCCGIWLLILSHRSASEATNQIDRDKNNFYEWIQNELMPTVDVSMVEAIGKLHETIDKFEPTFSGVISQFKDAFKDVTGAFGTEFRKSVQIVASAVDSMGNNMDKVNENIDLQSNLLATIKSNELVRGMDAFVAASKRFSEVTGSLDQFERARRIMLVAAQETINIQKDFNESLQIPKQVAAEINAILNRITKFEESINGLGVNIAQTQMVGNQLVEQIKANINAIKTKQAVAEKYAEKSNNSLENYFEEQKKEVSLIMQKYNEALEAYLNDYENMLKERKSELESRNKEFVEAIDRKLSLEDIRNDFKALRDISQKIELLTRSQIDGNKLDKALEGIRTELNAISAIQEDSKKGWFSNSSSQAVERVQKEKDEAKKEAEVAKREAELAKIEKENAKRKAEEAERKQRALEEEIRRMAEEKKKAEQENTEKEEIQSRIRIEQEREKIAQERINEIQNVRQENAIESKEEKSPIQYSLMNNKQQEVIKEEEPKKRKGLKNIFRNLFSKN